MHCVVSGGALAPEGRWVPAKRGFLFPVRGLSVVFRAKYLEALEGAFEAEQLDFAGETTPLAEPSAFGTFLAKLRAKDWVVYAKPPFGGPAQVLAYLGRYTHRIAIGNERLLDCENGEVRFRYRDYAHGNKTKVMCFPVEEFIRRFLLHVLPKAFMRIRHYGLLANRHRTEHLDVCRAALDAPTPAPAEPETVEAFLSRVLGTDANRCPHCREGRLRPVRAPPAPPSGHRSAAPAMGGLNRTGRSPAFMRYRMNPSASPLRRPRPTPPRASFRPRLPLTLHRFRTILPEQPNSPIYKGIVSHGRRPEPTGTASRPHPAPYNPQGP